METYVIKDGRLYTISISAPELKIPDIMLAAKDITQANKLKQIWGCAKCHQKQCRDIVNAFQRER